MSNMLVKPNKDDLIIMKELIEAGKVVPRIDRRFPLSEFAKAFRYLEEGHAQGKVVITVEPTASALELSATKITSTLPAIAV